ncbi:thioredoxin-disulfide reductase [candidate division KSB1 bacterium]|nr:thioredoxin-disulfide reductase [candidate division KSB1 bacterium]
MENTIIIGGGPTGYTAAIYTSRSLLQPKLFSGATPGGQITLTNDLENYPGFPEGIGGFDIFQKLDEQAKKFGSEIINEMVTEVDLKNHPFTVKTESDVYQTKSIIIATGASPRKLNVTGEKEFTGKGVSYCATCDGFFFRGKHVAVIGGGNSALDEGIFLTRFASKVSIIHRRDRLRGSAILQERAQRNEKIEFIWDTVVEEIQGDQIVQNLKLKNVKTNEISNFPIDGVFVFIGYNPNSELFKGQLNLDEEGYILVNEKKQTNIPGVFAAGDIEDKIYRQVSTCVGAGTIAALETEKFLAELEGNTYPGK